MKKRFRISIKYNDNIVARLLTILFFCLLFLLSIFLIITTIVLFKYSHSSFCHLLLSRLGKLDQASLFKESLLSEKKYQIVRTASVVISLICLLLTGLFIKKRGFVQQQFVIVKRKTNTTIRNQIEFLYQLPRAIKFYLLALLFTQLVFFTYCAFKFPISYDEAWTYLNFTNKSVISSASYYPAPNNHVFFSILTNITNTIPIGDPKIKMRIINIVFSILSSLTFFKLLYKFYSPNVSLYTMSLFTFSYPLALYSVQARGYEMLFLFSLIATYSTISYIFLHSKKHLWIYLFAIIAGFYTIPTYLYFFISLQFFIFGYCLINLKTTLLKKFIVVNMIGGLIVLMLYTPIIFINGLTAITTNPYTKSISFPEFMNQLGGHVSSSINWLLGINKGGEFILALIIITSLHTLLNKNNNTIKAITVLMLVIILSPPLLIIVQRVIPFERTWIYLTIPIFFGLSNMLTLLLNNSSNLHLNRKLLFDVALTVTTSLLILNFPIEYRNKHKMDYQANNLFSKIDVTHIRKIASNEVLMTDLLNYKINTLTKNHPVKFIKIADDSAIDADAIILNTNFIPHIPNIKDYTFIEKNDFIQLYLKKVTNK